MPLAQPTIDQQRTVEPDRQYCRDQRTPKVDDDREKDRQTDEGAGADLNGCDAEFVCDVGECSPGIEQ